VNATNVVTMAQPTLRGGLIAKHAGAKAVYEAIKKIFVGSNVSTSLLTAMALFVRERDIDREADGEEEPLTLARLLAVSTRANFTTIAGHARNLADDEARPYVQFWGSWFSDRTAETQDRYLTEIAELTGQLLVSEDWSTSFSVPPANDEVHISGI